MERSLGGSSNLRVVKLVELEKGGKKKSEKAFAYDASHIARNRFIDMNDHF